MTPTRIIFRSSFCGGRLFRIALVKGRTPQ